MSALYLRQIDDPYSFRNTNSLQTKFANFLWKWLFSWFLKPFTWGFDLILKSILCILRMQKPFTREFQDLFVKKFVETFKMSPSGVDTEVHWLTYSYLCQNDPDSMVRIRRWLTQYSFARNVSTAFILLFFFNIIMSKIDNPAFLYWSLATGAGSILFLLRYYYLYYNYYSKYIFRAFMTYGV